MAAVGIAAAAAGVVLGPRMAGSPGGAEALRSASFMDLSGKPRRLAEWDGRILVVNFWATWCPPCREEIPAFVRVRDKLHLSGVEFLWKVVGMKVAQQHKLYITGKFTCLKIYFHAGAGFYFLVL